MLFSQQILPYNLSNTDDKLDDQEQVRFQGCTGHANI